MKVLVIGGTRFVGLRLVKLLVGSGHDVTILNRGKTAAQLPQGTKRLYADRRDSDAVKKTLAGQDFEVVFDITAYDTRNLAPMVEIFSRKVAHYIFISTCGVYRTGIASPANEESPRVHAQTAGVGPYELNKVFCEDYLMTQFRHAGFPVTILRCPFIYGPENWMHDREFSYFVRLTIGRKLIVPGSGNTLLHLAHVDDVAGALVSASGNSQAIGQEFNIAGPEAVTIAEFMYTIAAVIQVSYKKVFVPAETMKKLTKPVFPYPWEYGAEYSIAKAERILNFKPQPLGNGIRQTYLWWKNTLGVNGTRFEPGKLGYNVDLGYEDEVLAHEGQDG